MPKFRVAHTSFIDNRLVHEGDIVDYDGEPSDNLEPVDKAAKKLAAATNTPEAEAEALARLSAAANAGDPDTPALTEVDQQDAVRMHETALTGAPGSQSASNTASESEGGVQSTDAGTGLV
jgi:hypothetical protein